MPIVPPESFQFCGPTYLAASPVIDAQRSINLYPEPGYKNSKTQMGLIGRPGLSAAPFITLAQSPARALWPGNNRLFAVGGTHFYELTNGGAVLTDFGAMAASTGVGPCTIINNGGSAAFQLLVQDTSSNKIYNAAGGVMTAVFNATAMEYLDGFQVAVATGASLAAAGNPNQVNVSAFGDATTWPALGFVIRTGSSDLVKGLAVMNGLLYIFGARTTEVWYNAGNPNFPFARVNGGSIGLGVMSAASIAKFYNTCLFLGGDDRGYAQVYMLQGMNPVRVSNPAIEYLLNQQTPAVLAQAWAYPYQEAGRTFYVLQFPAAGYGFFANYTLCYDLSSGLWHERTYGASWPCSIASLPGFAAGGPYFVGDGLSGKIYFQGINFPNDGTGNSINYVRIAPHITNTNQWIKYPRFELDGDFGTAQPMLGWSNNGGRTFGLPTAGLRNMQQAVDQGAIGTFRRYFALQLGRSRDRVFYVSITDNANLIRIANAVLTANPGTGN